MAVYTWLIVTDLDRIFEIRSSEQSARRTAKAIDGYMIRLEITEDYRKQTTHGKGDQR